MQCGVYVLTQKGIVLQVLNVKQMAIFKSNNSNQKMFKSFKENPKDCHFHKL